jgi:cysteinyl-tRNA synthetase
MLHLWNSLHRRAELDRHALEEFKPIKSGEVGLYTCGPTVYNSATIGNLRAYVFDDILARTLRFLGYHVTQVMNVTDVGHLTGDQDLGEDKVEREAIKQGKTAWEIAREYEARFFYDTDRLHILRPNIAPRATEHIEEQIALIKILEEKGFVYRISDGMYFDTAKFPAYGKLSGQKLDEKEAGARVEVHPEKKQPSDFALWKFSPTDQKRQMEWESPWGIGFPGWHIQCSAMSVKYLGQPFDIHCGGIDHLPVHHENEIAQSEAAYDKPLANYWLHNDFLLVDGRRMGKSQGNMFTLEDIDAHQIDPLAYRLFCLGAHYRSKLNFTWEGLQGAQNALDRLRKIAMTLRGSTNGISEEHPETLVTFTSALEEDLNTPKALAVMWGMLEADTSEISDEQKLGTLFKMDEVLGFNLVEEEAPEPTEVPEEVQVLQRERDEARQQKDFKNADRLRQEIKEKGWLVEDQPKGTSTVSRCSSGRS